MNPTPYLRFVWLTESEPVHYDSNGQVVTTRVHKVRVLQQFWASPNGASESVGGAPGTIAGEWRDVPLEEQA